jgi:hypothetical protein
MRWVGHVELMREERCTYRFWWKNVRGRHHSEDLGLDDRIILKWIFKEQDGRRRSPD